MSAYVFSDASCSSPFSVKELRLVTWSSKTDIFRIHITPEYIERYFHWGITLSVRISTLLIALPLNNLQDLQHLPCYADSVLEVLQRVTMGTWARVESYNLHYALFKS